MEPHALERALEDRQAPARLEADEKDLRRLVGRENEARAEAREPGGKVQGRRQLEDGLRASILLYY